MKDPVFRSSLGRQMADFVAWQRAQGFAYASGAECLRYFDRFLGAQGYQQTQLDRQIVDAYQQTLDPLSAYTQANRLTVLRVFSRFLRQTQPTSYVPYDLSVKRPASSCWYLYSSQEIAILLQAALALGPRGSLRPHSLHLLLGLLYVTGLRIGEALALNLEDLDGQAGRLFVRRGKFGKSRYVPLHPSTSPVIDHYLRRRRACGPAGRQAPVFIDQRGQRLTYKRVHWTFDRMLRRHGLGQHAPRRPRLHDLRHTFACNCLELWRQQGLDVNAKLPVLATVMGHVEIESTQLYLHVTAADLRQAADRFHAHCHQPTKGL